MQQSREIKLKYHNIWIDATDKTVITYYNDNGTWRNCTATREDNAENWTEATQEGYDGDDRIWNCFVDHEILHCFLSEKIFDTPSPVMLNEMGIEEHQPYWKRLLEEVFVIQFQHFLNKKEVLFPLYGRFGAFDLEDLQKEFEELKTA